MKILYVATVRSHIGQFHMPVIRKLVEDGHEVHAAFHDNSADKKGLDLSVIHQTFEIPFVRSPYSLQNVKAYFALKRVIRAGHYDIIHCHTPVGAMLTRLAARAERKKGTRVFYTAHGFHFYKGAPKKNWLFFYPVEKLLSGLTDVLITINQEDYDLAVHKHFRAGKIVKIDGVGVDLSKFSVASPEEREQARAAFGLKPEQFVLLYAADLSVRKNQPMIFRALARLKDACPNIVAWMPGQPILKEEYERQCEELGITSMVRFMGYRRDIDKLLTACDCVVSSSRQEGLPINLIEAAASGKYIIATDVRGNADVVKQSGYGTLVKLNDDKAMAEAIVSRIKNGNPFADSMERLNVYDKNRIVHDIMAEYGLEG